MKGKSPHGPPAAPSRWRRLTTAMGQRPPEVERRSRMLLSILVCLLGLSLLAAALTPFQFLLARTEADLAAVRIYPFLDLGLILVFGVAYIIARRGHTKEAAAAVSVFTILAAYGSVFATGEHTGLITLGFGPLLAGLLLSRRATAVLTVVAAVSLMTLPVVVDGIAYREALTSLLFTVALGALSVVSASAHERDLRQIEEQSRQIAADAERLAGARKMEAVARLAAGQAHEFNNIMAGVMGFAEAIDARPGEAATYARRIREAATRASNQTEHLLSFSRQQLLRPVATSVNDLVARVGRKLGGNLRMELAPESAPTLIDPELMERALEALIIRAIRQAGPGGRVTVATADGFLDANDELRPRSACRVISVADDGPGLDDEILHRIFEPYYTTGEFGTGDLDLAAAYGIVGQSGGNLSASRPPGGGNRFLVQLPVAAPQG